ncbi:hypothetical protein N8873_05480 [Flavobacteriaceae bacterium]|nr:hypothetical protein [Flavobacteriaceae bacterium]
MFNQKDTEKRILDKISTIKSANRKIVIRKPKRIVTNQEKQLKRIKDKLFNSPKGQTATETLKEILKLLK